MPRFLSCKELYETIKQKSKETKSILWVCTPSLGADAHQVFSQEILKNPGLGTRFVFNVTDFAVKSGAVNPYEIQFFLENFKDDHVRSHDNFNSNLYIFDDSALITSANLTKPAFESALEAGVLLDDTELDEVKSFFNILWENAKTIREIQKLKKTWNNLEKNLKLSNLKKNKPHTKIKDWTDNQVSQWYFTIPDPLPKKIEQKIKKETNLASELSVVADIGPSCFKNIKLGDLAYLAHLAKKRGKIEVELARIHDKTCVETDEGDHHFAYKTEKTFLLERNRFYEMLKTAAIGPKTWAAQLNDVQVASITNSLALPKPRKKRKPHKS